MESNYCENIYRLRKKEDISQEALAIALGTTRQQVSRWECGASIPSPRYAYALAKYFHCSVAEIMGEDIEGEEGGSENREPLHFRNTLLIFSFALLLSYCLSVLAAYFSNEIATYLHEVAGAMRKAGVEYDPATVNGAIRGLSESIYAISLVCVAISSLLILTCACILFARAMRSTQNRIIRAELFSFFSPFLAVALSVILGASIYLTVGQHVSFLGPYTFGLFDGLAFLFGAYFAIDVILTLFRILLRQPLSKRMVLRPWAGATKVFEIIYIVIGIPLFVVFLVFGSGGYFGFAIMGFLYIPAAIILVIVHLLVCYRPFGLLK